MSEMNRRSFGAGLAMLGTLGAATAGGQAVAGVGTLGASRVIVPELTKLPNGSERWAGVAGTLATGEAIGMHESVVPAGTPKTTLHVIKHSELLVVIEGTLGFAHDGIEEKASAGSVLYVAYGTNHLVWNAGETTARYFVLQIGGDTKKG